MTAKFDVGCAADLCVDFLLSGNVVPRFGQVEQYIDDYAVELGGSATIFAGQLAKLGGRAAIVGVVGEDAFGALILGWLKEIGLDVEGVRRDPAIKTGLGVSLVKPDGDRGMLTYSGGIGAVGPEALTDALLRSCRHWHLASYFLLDRLRSGWAGWLSRCREVGLTTSLDTNWDPEERWVDVTELLPLVDVFLPNDAEACAISGETDVFRAGERLAARGPLVVVKRGGEGAVAFRGGERWSLGPATGAARPARIVDTVGAGDNFDAGFLRGWLLGWEIDRCLELAGRCARASLEFAGGFRGQLREAVA
jgi:sugar/nucleoside kinase (ribokinase family)